MIRFHSITGLPRAAPSMPCLMAGMIATLDFDPPSPSMKTSEIQKFVIKDCDCSSFYEDAAKEYRGKPYDFSEFSEFTRNLQRRKRS